MAHGLLDEGINTLQSKNDSVLSVHLKKYKLPIQTFANNDVTESDLENFDFEYFDGMCQDLGLNTIQKIRFKKLIQDLNMNEKNRGIQQQIAEQVKLTENKINQTFSCLMNDLEQRKHELIEELHRLSELKVNEIQRNTQNANIKTNIEFIYDDSILKKTIFNFGLIVDGIKYLKPPEIVASFVENGIKINFKECDDMKYDELIIEYKKYEIDDEKQDLQKWKIIKNALIIANIEPLTTYCIRSKYKIDDKWSEYSQILRITSKLDCIWDTSCHKKKSLQFIDNYKIHCNAECGALSVISKPIFNGDLLKKVKFEFVIDEFCQTSMFGLISTPINKTMKGYWRNNIIANNKYSFILETMDGLNCVHRYKFGKDIDNSLFSSSGITLSNKIEKGDHFIFDIDFDEDLCNVYINSCQETNKIRRKTDVATWTDIGKQIVPVYGHSVSRLIKKTSSVQIKLLSYEMR